MTHHQVQHTIRAKAMFLAPMNDFEIAMILADVKCLPSRITGYRHTGRADRHGPEWISQCRNELCSFWTVDYDTGLPAKHFHIY